MARVPAEKWDAARAIWEADPAMEFQDIAALLGCSAAAVGQRAAKQGWRKGNSTAEAAMQVIEGHAEVIVNSPPPKAKPSKPKPPKPEPMPLVVPDIDLSAISATDGEVREVVARHRTELMESRRLIYRAASMKDENGEPLGLEMAIEYARLGKLTADGLRVIQEMERKAWGLDQQQQAPVTIVFAQEVNSGWT